MSRKPRIAHRATRRAFWRWRTLRPPRGLPLWVRVALGVMALSAGAAAHPAALQAQMQIEPAQDPTIAPPNASEAQVTFTIRPDDLNNTRVTLELSCDGAVTSCSAPPWVDASTESPATVTVTFTTASEGSGTITLTGTDQLTLETEEGGVTINVESAPPSVDAASGTTQYTAEQVQTNYPDFTVTNHGNTAVQYTLTANCNGNIEWDWQHTPSCGSTWTSSTVDPYTSITVPVYYISGAASSGNGYLTLTATSPYGETASSAQITIVPVSEAVQVTPDGASTTLGANGTAQVPFTVHETGNAGAGFRYVLTVSCSGSIVSCSFPSTGTDTTSLPPSPGVDQTVSAWIHATSDLAGGAGTVTLTASTTNSWGQTYQDQGSYAVTVPDSRVGLPLSIVTPTSSRNPGSCVASCFDATYAYSTPAYTSLDVPRSVTMGYRSSLAHPMGIISIDANDTTASGARQISVRMWRAGTPVTFTNGTTESFFTGAPGNNRLSVQYDASQLASGVSRDSVVVTAYLNDGTSRPGSIVVPSIILSAASSPLGSGWTILGLVQGFVQGSGDIMISDGTGAASVFSKPAGCVIECSFTAPAGDFRTLTGPARITGAYALRAPDGTVATLDGSGYATSVADRFGNTTQYTYTSGALHTITDPAGQVTTLAYGTQPTSGATVLQSITTPGGRTTQVTVDASRNLTQILRPDGSYGFAGFYDAAHRMTRWYNRATQSGGNLYLTPSDEWDITYDSAQKVSSVTEPQLVADGTTVRPAITYASIEAAMIALPGSGNGTSASPVAHIDTATLRARITDARGNATAYTLDRAAAPVRVDEPLGRTTIMQRDYAERVSQVTTPAGDQVTYTYSGPDLIATHDGYTNRSVRMDYEPTYHQVARVYGDADSVWNYWSAAGRLDSTRTGTSTRPVMSYTYDARGRMVRRAQSGLVDSVHYAPSGWQNTDTSIVAGRTSSQHFNSWGLVDQVTDAAGHTSQMIYDGIGRVQMAIGPRADTTTYYYDALFLTGVKDANGQLYQYFRNGLGWTTQQVDPRKLSTYFGYDRNGNITSTTNRRGQSITATYDALDNMTSQTADGATTTYATDPLGRYVMGSNAESVDTVKYDPAGRMSSEIAVRNGYRFERASSYNLRDERTQVAFTSQPWGWAVSSGYHYDGMGRLDTLTDMAGGKTVIGYDALDRPTSTILPNGLNIGTPFANILRPTDLTYSNGTINASVGASYSYGSRGELTDRIAPSGTAGREFDTDAEGQLTGFANYTMQAGTCKLQQMPPDPPERVCDPATKAYGKPAASYGWDKVGNPAYNGAVIDAGNRLRQFGSDSLAYDPDGNLVGRYQNHVLVQSLVWDALGQLTSVTTNGATVSFGYDAFGRRVRKTVPGDVLWYVHDGDNVWTLADNGGAHLISITAYYPGVDQPNSIFQGGAISYYLQDVSGNVTGLVNNAQQLQNHYSYLPFGGADTTVETATNTLRFAAREYDPETGLYYMRARYYDPNLGRFISEDPVGLDGGVNLYTYAGNAPLDRSDPLGLDDGVDWQSICNYYGGTYTEQDSQHARCVVGGGPVTLPPISISGWAAPAPVAGPTTPDKPERGGPFPFLQHVLLGKPMPRLFETHYCGAGGGGAPTNDVDRACAQHDACYGAIGITASFNTDAASAASSAQIAGAAECNQRLCNAMTSVLQHTSYATWTNSALRRSAFFIKLYFRNALSFVPPLRIRAGTTCQ